MRHPPPGPRSQRLVKVINRTEDKVSWREAKDHDNQAGDRVAKSV